MLMLHSANKSSPLVNQRRKDTALARAIEFLRPENSDKNVDDVKAIEQIDDVAADFRAHQESECRAPTLKVACERNRRIYHLTNELVELLNKEQDDGFLVDHVLPLLYFRPLQSHVYLDLEILKQVSRAANLRAKEIQKLLTRRDAFPHTRGGRRSNLWLAIYGPALRILVADCVSLFSQYRDLEESTAGRKGNLHGFCVAMFEYAMEGAAASDRTIGNYLGELLPTAKALDLAVRSRNTHILHAQQLDRMGRTGAAAEAWKRYEEAAVIVRKLNKQFNFGPVLRTRRNAGQL
jgi:hypothetical protein